MTPNRFSLSVTVLLFVFGLTALTQAWTRTAPARNQVAPGVNVEQVAHEFRVQYLGEQSVLIPADEGGTGNRMMHDVYALQVKSGSTWVTLIRAWGATDDVVPYLQARMRMEQTRVDVMMFNQPTYTPNYQFVQ